MKKNMRSATNGLTGLNLLREKRRAGACRGHSLIWLILLLLAVFMTGCGGSGSSGGDNSAPTLSSTVPAANATGVALDTDITATFSSQLDTSTVSRTTFTVTAEPDTPVQGEVSLSADGLTAIFNPTANLAANTEFAAKLTGVEDINGKILPDVFWTFTTGTTLSPTVVSTFPEDFATGVATNAVISAEFSVAMDPLTIDTTTFTVTPQNKKPIAGIVALSADGLTATFTPSAPLAANTQFLARITTGVKDLNGNAMKADKSWLFQTGL